MTLDHIGGGGCGTFAQKWETICRKYVAISKCSIFPKNCSLNRKNQLFYWIFISFQNVLHTIPVICVFSLKARNSDATLLSFFENLGKTIHFWKFYKKLLPIFELFLPQGVKQSRTITSPTHSKCPPPSWTEILQMPNGSLVEFTSIINSSYRKFWWTNIVLYSEEDMPIQ